LLSWRDQATSAFLRGYDEHGADPLLLQPQLAERNYLLRFFLIERALHELLHELEIWSDDIAASLEALLALAN